MQKASGIILCLSLLLTGCAAGSSTLYEGSWITVSETKAQDSVSIHTEYNDAALAVMEDGDAPCSWVEENAKQGGTLTLSDGSKISLDITVQTTDEENQEAMYGMTFSSLSDIEATLGIDLLEPEGLEVDNDNSYALTADPDFSSVDIVSAPLSWGDHTVFLKMVLYPKTAGIRATDDTLAEEPTCESMTSTDGLQADVLILDTSSRIILRSGDVLYEYSLATRDAEVIQSFLDSLQAEE